MHEDSLQGIGIVAYPYFIEIGEHAVVYPAAATSACLHYEVGVFFSDTSEYFLKTFVVIYCDLQLPVGGQILRTKVHYARIGIPFYVGNFRVFGHKIVYYRNYEILDIRIRQIEQQLRASTGKTQFAVFGSQYPVGMLFVKFA